MTFRRIVLKSGKTALAGKNAETNEELIKQVKEDEYVLHTSKPGSPFVNIKSDFKEVDKKDLKDAAVFCAAFSQAWKKAKKKPKTVEVHYFLGRDIFKVSSMKTGTFGVKKMGKINVRAEEIES